MDLPVHPDPAQARGGVSRLVPRLQAAATLVRNARRLPPAFWLATGVSGCVMLQVAKELGVRLVKAVLRFKLRELIALVAVRAAIRLAVSRGGLALAEVVARARALLPAAAAALPGELAGCPAPIGEPHSEDGALEAAPWPAGPVFSGPCHLPGASSGAPCDDPSPPNARPKLMPAGGEAKDELQEGDPDRTTVQGIGAVWARKASSAARNWSMTLLSEAVRAALAEIAWVGVPEERQRGEAWQLLLGYRPTSRRQQAGALQARRCQYQEMRCGIYEGSSCSSKGGGEAKAAALQQIRVDLPRTEVCRSSPGAAALQAVVDSELVQALMERVLFVWSTQEPAAGYVQGMNDVLLPLLFVLLSERTAAPLAEAAPHRHPPCFDYVLPDAADQAPASSSAPLPHAHEEDEASLLPDADRRSGVAAASGAARLRCIRAALALRTTPR
ncbi:unnamed protein product [Prorocentrum cordatum]|uniref:Rab-GAP TBC domain-containing protein n=1 Tax=Prorocentrum cordatum TaxID=2364126 RepID=A0ABN9QWQ6_9DINO|nr:unnamed protein product [Polarella glacialis]